MAMFGSSSPFGASSSSPFGGAPASSNPFGTSGQSNPFGVSQSANPFGAKPFGTSPFGGQTGSSLFGGGTSTGVFGAPQQSGFGGTTSAFGASSSTPTFGNTSTPFGSGTPAFGQKPTTSFGGGFGTTPAQPNPFGTFGQTQSAFGSQPFGSTSAFGATSQPAFGSTTTPAFGSSTPAFGASTTPAFGSTTATPFGSSAPAFGSSSVFGQSTPAFGSSSSPAFGSTSFGGSASSPFGAPQSGSTFGAATTPAFSPTTFGASFGGQRNGSRAVPYAVTNDPDVSVGGQVGKFMSISAMPAYNSKSPEELRWEDYQANDKGGPNPASNQPATGGIFAAQTPSPFGGSSTGAFGQQPSASNPFASSSTSSIFGPKPTTPFGAASTPAFGSTPTPAFGQGFGSTPSPFGQSSSSAFGQATAGAFGSTPSPFGASSGAGFGSSTFGATPAGSPLFSSTPGFTSSAFSTLNTPGNVGSSSPFGSSQFFGGSQPAGNMFGTPSSQGFGVSTPAFGAPSAPAFNSNIFNSGSTSSIFAPPKTPGLSQAPSPSPFTNFGQTAPGQQSFTFPSFQASQPGGSSIFSGATGSPFGQNTFAQAQPASNLMMAMPQPVVNPFGTLPAMPQMSIGRSAGSGPSVQYGISSMPVSDKPTQVRTTSLLTPRHITQRSKIRMHARRYNPKKDSPKVSFFSDGEEAPSTPKADVMFVPRENPRALFIRQPDQNVVSLIPTKGTPDPREIAATGPRNGSEIREQDTTSSPAPAPAPTESEGPMESWPSADAGDGNPTSAPVPSKPVDKSSSLKSISKANGVREDHHHRGNGYISITGHRAGEAAIAYEHGADIEALMPKLRHSDYFTEPRIQELAAKERAEPGYCRRVHDFVVGRRAYGSVKFLGDTDVRRLDLESIIQFNKCEVLVYMDESRKPAIGQGLNKPAEVSLLNVKCVDKKTGQHFTEGPEVEKFEKRLRRKTEEQGAEFLSFDPVKGEWRFQVKHFSRYGLDDSDESDEEAVAHSRQEKAIVLSGTDMMEGVEGESDILESPDDFQLKSPELEASEYAVGIDDEEDQSGGMRDVSPQAALPHSLPSQLRLDPLKMQQMKALFFPLGEDVEDLSFTGSGAKSRPFSTGHREVFKRPSDKVHTTVEEVRSAWPHRSPWKGGPSKQLRLTTHTSWKPTVPYSPVQNESQRRKALPVSDAGSSSPGDGALLVSLHGADEVRSTLNRDGGFTVEFSDDSESVTTGRYDHIVDSGLFFGRSFRVGWGPNGLLVHSGIPAGSDVGKVVLSSQLHIERVALDSTVRDEEGKVVEELVDLQFVSPLKLHMSMSQPLGERPGLNSVRLNLRKLVCNRTELSAICDEYEEMIHKQHQVKGLLPEYQLTLRHQVIVWQLLDVLFSDILPAPDADEEKQDPEVLANADALGRVELLLRRAEFSRWLQTSVSHLVEDDLELLDEDDKVKEVFILLTGRKVDTAVMTATFGGDIRLACLLSQAGASVRSRHDVATQLSVWRSEGLDHSLIEDDLMAVYKLLAGDVSGALENYSVDWKRFLGLIMWYQLSPDTDLSTIISTYQQFIGDNYLPIPMYVEEGVGGKLGQVDVFDTSYYMMLLHASKGSGPEEAEIRKMFSSASTTFDCLDHRMAWHQNGFLHAVGVLEPLHLHELHMSFVAQLLAVGLCQWAVYVVLHIPEIPEYPGLHLKVVKEILAQHCETWSKSPAQREFLEQDLGIPLEWLHEALAMYAHYVGDSKQQLEHLINSLQWSRAQTLFMTTVAAALFLKSEHEEVWRFASLLEVKASDIENWDLGGAIFFDYYNLKNRLVAREDDVMDELDTLDNKTSDCKAFFARLKESERAWRKSSSKDLRVVYCQMADELAGLLLVETHAGVLGSSAELKGYDAAMDAPVQEHVRACRIQGALSAFTSWLSEPVA